MRRTIAERMEVLRMTNRFIIDDAGTLIDMQTRDTFDYVSDVCGLLNELTEENEHIKQTIKDMIKTERTELGQSVLRQLREAIQ